MNGHGQPGWDDGQRGWAVVTGASSGIGAALARGLAARGHPLVLVARDRTALEVVADEARQRHGAVVRVRPCDLASPDQRRDLVAELAGVPVAVLCANAGFPTCGPLYGNDPAREADEVQVNVVALHQLVLAVLPAMVARGDGAVLVTGSTAGRQPVPTAATYAATKAFANTFAESLHAELRGTGVRCTLLAPGPVRTGFYSAGGVPGLRRHRRLAWLAPDRVAEEALVGLLRGRRQVVPGAAAKVQALVGARLPRPLMFALLRRTVLPLLRASTAPTAAPHELAPADRRVPYDAIH